jgi:predicted TIM-barrel fold metal-dependent hydrolase
MRIVDAHAHVWEEDTTSYPWDPSLGIQPNFSAPVESLLGEMEANGVQSTVLVQPSNYGFDNSYLIDSVRRYSQRFAGVALVNPWAEDAGSRLEWLVERSDIHGARLVAALNPQAPWLDRQLTRAFWAKADDLGIPICVLVRPVQLPQLERVVAEWTSVRVVVDHLGHAMVDPTPANLDDRSLLRLARYPNVYVKISGLPVVSHKPYPHQDVFPLIREVLESFGPHRLMWSSDFPYVQQQCGYGRALAIVRDEIPFFSDEDRAWILGKTASTLWPQLLCESPEPS